MHCCKEAGAITIFIRIRERSSQVPQPTCYWKWVGGTNPSRADNFSSEAPSLKMWLVPPHMSHIFGFSGMQGRMLACQNLRKSIQKSARADLVPPPVCQFADTTSFPSYLFQFDKWISLLGDFTFVIGTFWCSLSQHQVLKLGYNSMSTSNL